MLQILYYISFTTVICVFVLGRGSNSGARQAALGGSLFTFFTSILLGPLLLERSFLIAPLYSWFGSSVLFGLDGISYLFVLLSILLTIICILVS